MESGEEMEFTQEQRTKWNASIIGCLRKLMEICEEHHLTYYCIGGTAIGAVRHNGLIPWDDDIDVGLPRPDYDRLVEICRDKDLGDYELATPERRYYPCTFAKLCDRRTTLVERKGVPCVYGLYVDVFPIDGTAPTKEGAVKLMKKYRRLTNKIDAVLTHYTIGEYLSLALKPREWGRMAVQTAGVLLGRERVRKIIVRRADKLARRYDYATAKNLVNYNGCYGSREIFPREWAETQTEHLFEGMMVKIPVNSDAYLRNVYGDYMQLPPVEKRVCQHNHVFFDLDKRWNIEELRGKN